MKQGTFINKLVIGAISLTILSYMGYAFMQGLTQPFRTVLSYPYQVNDTVETTGYVVREEMVIYGATDLMDIEPAEGERVAVGGIIAYLYQDTTALDRRQELDRLTLDLEQYQFALTAGVNGWDNTVLDEGILDTAIQIKTSVAQGDLTALESQSLLLSSLLIRREYAYNGESDVLELLIEDTQAQINALQLNAYRDTAVIRATQSGLYSALTDGFESRLSPSQVEDLTPALYNTLTSNLPQAPSDAVGKVITSNKWQFITLLDQEDASRLVEGKTITVRFSRDWSGEVPMKVVHLSSPSNGQVAVTLESDRYLDQITLLRMQTVELVFDSVTGIRVPKMALRTVTLTTTNPSTGEETSRQAIGVYAVVGLQAEFKEVTILADDGDYYLLAPIDESNRTALRAGDEVIISASDLYDGKVLQ